jgi:hypothetical protein
MDSKCKYKKQGSKEICRVMTFYKKIKIADKLPCGVKAVAFGLIFR